MSLFEVLDIVEAYERRPVPRIFRDRTCPYDTLSDTEFRKDYRFSRPVFFQICDMMKDRLEHHSGRGSDLTVADQVGIYIHLLGRNIIQSDAARIAGCNQATVSRALESFLAVINEMAGQFIRWPDREECAEIRRSFFRAHGLPGIVGIIEGTHCKIMRSSDDPEDYICRKSYPSLNAGIVIDFTTRIRWVSAKWPGSAHDSRVFKTSVLYRQLERNEVQGAIIGDSAYALETFLLKPLNNPQTRKEVKYNKALCSARAKIERSFGVLKRQWHILHGECRYAPEKAAQIIVACCVLRNIAIDAREPRDYDEYRGRDMRDGEVPVEALNEVMEPPRCDAKALQRSIIENYF
ncbi:hypothetical protein Aduo_005569 [Ancylostoma duodenale]